MRSLWLWLALLSTLVPLAGAQADASGRTTRPRDVLLVLLDDIGTEDALPGLMPRLHELAARGVTYTNAYSNPTCSPSRRSLHFSRWWTGESGDPCAPAVPGLPPLDAPTLARLFPGRTGLFGKWHVGGNPRAGAWERAPLEWGFDAWHGSPQNLRGCGGRGYEAWTYSDGATSTILATYQPSFIRDELLAWWHAPERGPRLAVWTPALAHSPHHWPPPHELPPGYPQLGLGERAKFEAMIVSADWQLGTVLDSIDLARTLVIVTSDNGAASSVAPDPERSKGTTWQEGIRVPFVIAGPGVPKGLTATRLVHLVDVLPTVAEYAGVGVPAGLDGLSLAARTRHEYVLAGNSSNTVFPIDVCAISTRYKLRRVGGVESFYDLRLDPGEQVDRISDPALGAEIAIARAWLDANLPPP